MTTNEYFNFPEGTNATIVEPLYYDMYPDSPVRKLSKFGYQDRMGDFAQGRKVFRLPKNLDELYYLDGILTNSNIRYLVGNIPLDNLTYMNFFERTTDYSSFPDVHTSGALHCDCYGSKVPVGKIYYEGKYIKDNKKMLDAVKSWTKIPYGDDIPVYVAICDNMEWVTTGDDVYIAGVKAEYLYSGKWKAIISWSEDGGENIPVTYKGEMIGSTKVHDMAYLYTGENQPIKYSGESISEIIADQGSWYYDSSNGYWTTNSTSTLTLNVSGNFQPYITSYVNRLYDNSSYCNIKNEDDSTIYSLQRCETFNSLLTATGSVIKFYNGRQYQWYNIMCIHSIMVNISDLPDDAPISPS